MIFLTDAAVMLDEKYSQLDASKTMQTWLRETPHRMGKDKKQVRFDIVSFNFKSECFKNILKYEILILEEKRIERI